MSVTWVVVTLSVGAAFGFAVSTNLKHASAVDLPSPGFSVAGLAGFVAATTRHPLWLLGVLADLVGLALQITALHLGALAVVQPLLVSGLLFTVALRRFGPARPGVADFVWCSVLGLALIGFLMVAGTGSHAPLQDAPDRLPAIVAALAGLGVAVATVWTAHQLRPAVTSAALLGVAVGICYATDAALLKAVANDALQGIVRLLTDWPLYAAIAVGALGLLLSQLAFQSGPVTASQPTIAAVDPLASVAIGVVIFDEHLRRGPWAGLTLAVLVGVLALSVVKLARLEVGSAALAQKSNRSSCSWRGGSPAVRSSRRSSVAKPGGPHR